MYEQWRRRNRSISSSLIDHTSRPIAPTAPLSGRRRPESTARRVDLPEPLGPMSKLSSPCRSPTETPLSANDLFSPVPKERVKPSPVRLMLPRRNTAGTVGEEPRSVWRARSRPATGTRPNKRAIRHIKRSSVEADSRCGGGPLWPGEAVESGERARAPFERSNPVAK